MILQVFLPYFMLKIFVNWQLYIVFNYLGGQVMLWLYNGRSMVIWAVWKPHFGILKWTQEETWTWGWSFGCVGLTSSFII